MNFEFKINEKTDIKSFLLNQDFSLNIINKLLLEKNKVVGVATENEILYSNIVIIADGAQSNLAQSIKLKKVVIKENTGNDKMIQGASKNFLQNALSAAIKNRRNK